MSTQLATDFDPAYATRTAVDRERAKRLLVKAGYAGGFEVTLDCPAGNDDGVCQTAAMLAQIGIRVRLEVMTNSVFSQKIREIEAASDPAKRTALIHKAQRVHNGEFGQIPSTT
jgi:peptide/nickel transport system substrate-binding protein